MISETSYCSHHEGSKNPYNYQPIFESLKTLLEEKIAHQDLLFSQIKQVTYNIYSALNRGSGGVWILSIDSKSKIKLFVLMKQDGSGHIDIWRDKLSTQINVVFTNDGLILIHEHINSSGEAFPVYSCLLPSTT